MEVLNGNIITITWRIFHKFVSSSAGLLPSLSLWYLLSGRKMMSDIGRKWVISPTGPAKFISTPLDVHRKYDRHHRCSGDSPWPLFHGCFMGQQRSSPLEFPNERMRQPGLSQETLFFCLIKRWFYYMPNPDSPFLAKASWVMILSESILTGERHAFWLFEIVKTRVVRRPSRVSQMSQASYVCFSYVCWRLHGFHGLRIF